MIVAIDCALQTLTNITNLERQQDYPCVEQVRSELRGNAAAEAVEE